MCNELFGMCNELFGMCNELFGMCNELIGMCNELVGMCNELFGMCNELSSLFYAFCQHIALIYPIGIKYNGGQYSGVTIMIKIIELNYTLILLKSYSTIALHAITYVARL